MASNSESESADGPFLRSLSLGRSLGWMSWILIWYSDMWIAVEISGYIRGAIFTGDNELHYLADPIND